MAWLPEYQDVKTAREQAEKAMRIPLGMTSPLWLAFGAAASVGAGLWWFNQWTRAANLEAPAKMKAKLAEIAPKAERAAPVIAEIPAPKPVVETASPIEPEVAPPAATAEPEVAPEVAAKVADDLTALVGIGPKLADALAAQGVTQFAQVAAWTAKDLDYFDQALNLRGRAIRNEWVAQAKKMI